MKIEHIISEGEKISENQLVDLCGGSSEMANENKAIFYCDCKGTGNNINYGLSCVCNDGAEPDPIIDPTNPGK